MFKDNRTKSSKLVKLQEIDANDEIDLAWAEHFKQFQSLVGDKPDSEVHSILEQQNLDLPGTNAHFSAALLYGILTQEKSAKYLRYLTHIVKDGFATCVSQLKALINDKYTKLLETAKTQLLWLISEFVKKNVRETDILCCNLLRQIPSGNVAPSSLWLADNLVDIFIENKGWLYMSAELIPYAVYTFTRIISDHKGPSLAVLKEKEVRFCIEVLREKFAECRVIGRDLVRLLQNLTKIPQFSDLWKDILQRPESLSSQFTRLPQLFAIRTPRRFLQSRVTPDMEKLLLFIMKEVKIGNQKRYQQWFAQAHLSTPESETLVVDIIRYICCSYHPPNSIIRSEIVPRWAVIGWLFNSIKKSTTTQANMKLALFYDWLFFDPKIDNIMNIEPGMLLMIHSIAKYAPVTTELLEFILVVPEIYYPAEPDITRKGVFNSVQIMLSKGVVGSIEPLIHCPTLSAEVRQRAIHCFVHFLPEPQRTEMQKKIKQQQQYKIQQQQQKKQEQQQKEKKQLIPMETDKPEQKEKQIVDHMDVDKIRVRENENANENDAMEDVAPQQEKPLSIPSTLEESSIAPQRAKLIASLKEANMSTLQDHWNQFISSFCSHVQSGGKLGYNLIKITVPFVLAEVGEVFCCFERDQYISRKACLFQPQKQIRVPLIDDIHEQLFTSFQEGKPNQPLIGLLFELRNAEPRIGYHFLLYLCGKAQQLQRSTLQMEKLSEAPKLKKLRKVGNRKEQTSHLHGLLESIPSVDGYTLSHNHFKSYLSCIANSAQTFWQDCTYCVETDPDSFFWMIPQLCKYIPMTHSPDFVSLLVSHIDPLQFGTLVGALVKGSFSLVAENVFAVIQASLKWGSYEQILLWQLIKAECKPDIIRILVPKVLQELKDSQKYTELLAGLLLLLKDIQHPALVKFIVTLPEHFKLFPTDLLSHWFDKSHDDITSMLTDLIDELCNSDSREVEKGKNVLLQLTVWIYRSPPSAIKKLPTDFVQTQLQLLISEFDDNQNYSNLLKVIADKRKS